MNKHSGNITKTGASQTGTIMQKRPDYKKKTKQSLLQNKWQKTLMYGYDVYKNPLLKFWNTWPLL